MTLALWLALYLIVRGYASRITWRTFIVLMASARAHLSPISTYFSQSWE